MTQLEYYPPGSVAQAFLNSDAFIRGIRGPIGSGKSVACCMEIMARAMEQEPNAQGIRRSRWAVVRNTYPELKTTTIKTWHEWFPSNVGKWQTEGPPTHWFKHNDLDLEVMFIALDRPDDVKKLLSLELTGAWINEAREIPKAILDGLTGRVGRFPPKSDGGPSWRGIIMDTNSPDTDHWWYVLAERDITTDRHRQIIESIDDAEARMRDKGLLEPGQPLIEFFHQPSAESPEAENLENLEDGYYERASVGKDAEWVKVYIRGDYGFISDGRPVYPEYRDNVHCQECGFIPALTLHVGLDFGLTPAAIFGQRLLDGRWQVIDELVTEDMGALRFGELLNSHLNENYAGATVIITGDPAGEQRAQTDESTPFQLLKTTGVDARPANTNDFTLRREAVAKPLSRMIDGKPGMIVSPKCSTLRKGLAGGYAYRRLQVVGQERYKDVPDKGSKYSHPCDAQQYMMLGAGEGQRLLKGNRPRRKLDYSRLNRGRA